MVKEFAFINFFRAIAAFWVLTAHCMIWGDWDGIPIPSPKIAVDLFMMISGYLMTANTSARKHFEPLTNRRNWFRFWLRRFFRLAPAYYVSLALAIATSSYFLGGYQKLQNLNPEKWSVGGVYDPTRIEYTLTNVILHLSFLFGLHPSYSFSTFLPDWSLSLEMQFYFAFPILMLSMQRFGFLNIAFWIGLGSFIVGLAISKFTHYYEPSLLFLKFNYFIAGMILARVLSANISKGKRLVLVLCAVFLVSLDRGYGKQLLVLPLLLLSMLILGWLEATNRTPIWISSLINSRFTRFASDTSYGVYLFHGFFISAFGLILFRQTKLLALPPDRRVLIMFLFVATSAYLTGYAVHRCIELPAISLGKQMIQRMIPIKIKQPING